MRYPRDRSQTLNFSALLIFRSGRRWIWCDEPAGLVVVGAAAWHGSEGGRVDGVVVVVDSGGGGGWEGEAGAAVGAGGPGPAAPPRQPVAAGAGADHPPSTESLLPVVP